MKSILLIENDHMYMYVCVGIRAHEGGSVSVVKDNET